MTRQAAKPFMDCGVSQGPGWLDRHELVVDVVESIMTRWELLPCILLHT